MQSLEFKIAERGTSCAFRLSALLLAVVVVSTTASTVAPQTGAAVSASPLPVRAWWTMATTARKDLERAAEFGVNTLIVQNDVEYMFAWNAIMDRLCLYDFSPTWRRQGAERQNVDLVRANYRGITADARRRGIDCYVMCAEFFLPKGFQPVSYDNPEVWTLVSNRLCEVFRALPDLSGYMLYLTEGDGPEVEFLPGSEPSKARRAQRLIETVWGACRAEHRKLIVATFIHTPAMLDAVAEALRSFPPHPDFAVMQYCCPNDWGLYALLNPAIGKVGPHPEILGFDCAAENWGQGVHPFVQVDFMAQRLTEARQHSTNIVGISCWVSWYGRQALGTFNEANIYAGYALAREPGRPGREIMREWCAKRFGKPAAEVAADCLGRTKPAVMKAQNIYGYWQDTWLKSGLPTLKELDEILVEDTFGEALTKWDTAPSFRQTWEGIQSPDETFLARVLAEKEEAIRLCKQSLDEVRENKRLFQTEDFTTLEKAFSFQAAWARAWRDRTHAFFLRRIGQKHGWPADIKTRLDSVLAQELANANELERRYGKDMYPSGPERERQFVSDIRAELATKKAPIDYFPPPESKGGWRKLESPEDIRRLAGMDPDKLTLLKQWLLDLDDRPFSAVVIRHGYIALEVERDHSSRTNRDNVASVAKPICAMVLAIASEESLKGNTPRRMTFEDPAFNYIPWAEPLSDPRKTQIKVKQLLNHTSGITPEGSGIRNSQRWEYILGHGGDGKTAKLFFDPGTDLGYSTHALYHAALVCENVTGKPYDQYAIEHLFKPLGIESWRFQFLDGDEKVGRHPSHGLGLPTRDMARIAYCMLHEGRWGDQQVVPQWFVRETAAPTHSVKGVTKDSFGRNAESWSHGWELPALEGGDKGNGIPLDTRFKPGAGVMAFIPSQDLVIARKVKNGGPPFEEYIRRVSACALP